jgi:uncharacterized RDD family membrane protein YckC
MTKIAQSKSPSFFKRTAAIIYELFLLIAVFSIVTFLFILIFGDATEGLNHFALQVILWFVGGMYFVFSWVRTGQTLAMKTWRIKLESMGGESLSLNRATLRYVLATAGLMFFGAGFIWALFDREGLYLHDRLIGARLRLTDKV